MLGAFGAMLGAAICGMVPPWLLKDVVDDVLPPRANARHAPAAAGRLIAPPPSNTLCLAVP